MKRILLAGLFLWTQLALGAGQIQNENVKSLSELTAAGGSASQLINDTKIYVTANGINSQLSSAITTGQIGGSSGGKNYLSNYNGNTGNGDFETNTTTGWSLFNTTLTSLIPTGSVTAGAASVTTFATTASSPLQKTYSLSTASSAAWAAGQGFISSPFTIDNADKAKVLTFKAYYSVVSGLANLNLSGTSSNTFAVYIYDTTASAWIQPSGVYGITQGSGTGYVTGTFQTTSSSTQYRLAIVAINASAGAVSMTWDDFSVSPQTAPSGAVVTDWQSYVATITGTTTNPTKGTVVQDKMYWRRVGDSIELRYEFKQTAAGTAGSGTYQFALPSGYTIDTTKVDNTSIAQSQSLGYFAAFSGATEIDGTVNACGTAVLCLYSSSGGNFIGSALGPLSAATTRYSFHAIVPITGWSSNVQMSNDTDTRVIAAQVVSGNAQAFVTSGTDTQATFGTVAFDNAGGISGNTYVVQVPGVYYVEAKNGFSANATGNRIVKIQVNSVDRAISNSVPSSAIVTTTTTSKILNLVAGDVVRVMVNQSSGGSLSTVSDGSQNNFSIFRLSGPSVVASTESVNAIYTVDGAGQTLTATGAIQFNTKTKDSHSAVTTGSSWAFKVPTPGTYAVCFQVAEQGASAGAHQFALRKNAATVVRSQPWAVAGVTNFFTNFTCHDVPALAGDLIDVFNSQTNAGSVYTAAIDSFISIKRVGN